MMTKAELEEAVKAGANLRSANLRSANLRSANLRSANLRSANLRSADLRSADLSGANLSGADLRSANLRSADLRSANLRSADLSGANLRSANLSGADLRSANLSGADLRSANLSGADLWECKGLAEQTVVNPFGDIVGWKKTAEENILRLRIPADAKRVNAYGSRKCRAEFAYIEWASANGPHHAKHNGVEYYVGRLFTPDGYNADPRIECSNGVHFFITREEAEGY